jgi:alanine dehydrogenase
MGARVTVVDRSAETLKRLSAQFGASLTTVFSTRSAIAELVPHADLLIGTVLVPGAAAPKLVTAEMVSGMKKGAVIVDVAIDQGGCVETAHPTTHSDPVYEVDGVVHYCVANMPGAVPRTSTIALTNATLPYTRMLASMGFEKAVRVNPGLAEGVNVYQGQITYQAVATSQSRQYTALADLL